MHRKSASNTAFVYLLISLFCILFGAVYELFSHEVYSYFMLYGFVFPLAGGTLPFLLLSRKERKKYPGRVGRYFYHCGIATLTVGSLIRGILDIYGTTNELVRYYWLVGVLLLVTGIGLAWIWPNRTDADLS